MSKIDEEMEQLQARIKELESQKAKQEQNAQELGFYARKSVEAESATIRTMLEYASEDLPSDKLYGAFQQINKSSYAVMRAIERDMAEKENV